MVFPCLGASSLSFAGRLSGAVKKKDGKRKEKLVVGVEKMEVRIMAKLDVNAFGLACGLTWGGAMFLLGVIDIFTVWGDAFGVVMSSFYVGYTPTPIGSLIGGAWGFCDAGIGGAVVAWLYNKLTK